MLQRRGLIICVLVVMVFTISCSNKEQPKAPQNSLPTSLQELNQEANSLISDLEERVKKETEEKINAKEEQSNGEQNKEENKKQEDEESKQKSKSQTEDKKKDKQKEKKKFYKEVESAVRKLHQNWNKYESEEEPAAKVNQQVESNLNWVTEAAGKKELASTLLAVNDLNLALVDLYTQHDQKLKSAVVKAEGYTRQIVYSVLLNQNKDQQSKSIKQLSTALKLITKESKSKQKVKQLTTAIQDLSKAVQAKQQEVIKVKGNLIISQLQKLNQ
ncbi:MAG: hypothetical protein ACQEQI_03875 [Bacillota bacterium]